MKLPHFQKETFSLFLLDGLANAIDFLDLDIAD